MPKPKSSNLDKLPPNATRAERALLGCILLDSEEIYGCYRDVTARIKDDYFYDLRNREIYLAMQQIAEKNKPIDLVGLMQVLKDDGKLNELDNGAYVVNLHNEAISVSNLESYLDLICEKYHLRKIIHDCEDAKNRAMQGATVQDVAVDLLLSLAKIESLKSDSTESNSWNELLRFDTSTDENNVIGIREFNGKKITTRYLCKGHSAWIIGPSGIGKSSLMVQFGVCFAAGKPCFGITPQKKLTVMVIQAENDKGDMAEMVKGINHGLGLELDDDTTLFERLKFKSVTGKIGRNFCSWLAKELDAQKIDLVLVDPLLSFAGIDVNRQDQVSQFCREWLDPILKKTGTVLISVHHTGKPPRRDGKKQVAETISELAYLALGSSELVNWARAIMLLQAVGDDAFKLTLAKRGKRAWACHPNGEPTCVLWLRHAQDGHIFWQQTDPPEEAQESETSESRAGAPSKIGELLALGLGGIIDEITEPISKNALADKFEAFAAAKNLDIGPSTCKKAVEQLVRNHALKKTGKGYEKA